MWPTKIIAGDWNKALVCIKYRKRKRKWTTKMWSTLVLPKTQSFEPHCEKYRLRESRSRGHFRKDKVGQNERWDAGRWTGTAGRPWKMGQHQYFPRQSAEDRGWSVKRPPGWGHLGPAFHTPLHTLSTPNTWRRTRVSRTAGVLCRLLGSALGTRCGVPAMEDV